jgi:uncharacterized protein
MKSRLLIFCSLFVFSTFSHAQNTAPSPIPNTIFAGADGKFETAPDTALIQFNISAQAESAKDAYDQASKQAEQTRQVLRANGIDPKTAQVGFFSVNPQYDWKNPKHRVIGYQVTTSVSLKLKDFSKIGAVTQQLADASVGESQSLSYTLDSTEDAKTKAVADAYRRVPRNPWQRQVAARSANSPTLQSTPSRTFASSPRCVDEQRPWRCRQMSLQPKSSRPKT